VEIFNRTVNKIKRVIKNTQKRGLIGAYKYFRLKFRRYPFIQKIRQKSLDNQIEKILEENKDKPIILSLSFIDWNVPLYQRPQHIAIQLAKQG